MRILFQGDSITDARRPRDLDWLLGGGYPTICAGMLVKERPNDVEVINRGVSGNRVVDLYARWKMDAINLKPDVISILIGVNDVWHEVGNQNGVDVERFEMVYNLLLDYTKRDLPETKMILLEPFVLKESATEEHWDYFSKEVALRAQATKRVAEKHGATFVPLQDMFDEAAKTAPASVFLRDGVHPTAAGHSMIADRWIEAFMKTMQ